MDARGEQRLPERILGLVDAAEHVGSKYVETMQREPGLSDGAKAKLELLYREHAPRAMQLHSMLGLAICEAIQDELDDDAREMLDLMRANFKALSDRLTRQLGTRD